MSARWSDLPKDLLENIFSRTFPCDHLVFTSVCSSWRSVGLQQDRYLPRQYVGLIVPGETADSETRPLIEPVQGQYSNNNVAINLQIPHNYYCCGSSLGWLVLVDDSLDMQLFNPITGVKFQLPSGITFSSSITDDSFDKFGKYNIDKAVLSCDPCSSTSSQAIVFVLYGRWNMAFSKLGDKEWTTIAKGEHEPDSKAYADAIYYKDKFYAVYNNRTPGGVVGCDLSDVDHPVVTDYAPPPSCEIFFMTRYLVESNGDLFQLRRNIKYDLEEDFYTSDSDNSDDFDGLDEDEVEDGQDEEQVENDDGDEVQVENDDGDEVTDDNDEHNKEDEVEDGNVDNHDDGGKVEHEKELLRRYKTTGFKIYKLVEADGCHHGRWKKMDNIGDNAFFVGYNSSFSLSATDYLGCKPNSVYFTDGRTPYENSLEPIRHDIGVYNLEDKSVAEVYPMDSKLMRPPPFWFTPIPWKSQVGSNDGEKEQEQNSEAAIRE